jgi:hypothetical protein
MHGQQNIKKIVSSFELRCGLYDLIKYTLFCQINYIQEAIVTYLYLYPLPLPTCLHGVNKENVTLLYFTFL